MVIYRQIYNRVFKRWSLPSRSIDGGKTWQRVPKPERFCTPRDGIAMAIWRMRNALVRHGYIVTEVDKQKTEKLSIFTFQLVK